MSFINKSGEVRVSAYPASKVMPSVPSLSVSGSVPASIMRITKNMIFIFLLILISAVPAFADRLSDMEEKIEHLTNELEELKMERTEDESKIHFHGYGELHYNAIESDENEMDMHRMVIGLTYSFTDRIILDAEVDFEHAAQEMELEFAHLDFLINDAFNIRAGAILMPVGYLNEYHEPPLFYSVERPYVQKYLIPTSWQEGGAGIFGEIMPGLRYRAYIVGGLDASGFTAKDGIRKGRQKVSEAKAEDLAFVGRLEYVGLPGLHLGASFYTGGAAQDDPSLGDADVTLAEVDGKYRIGNLELIGLYTRTDIGDTDKIFAATGQAVGEEQTGWYTEAAYHIPFSSSKKELVVFARREEFDTQKELSSGLTKDPANDREVTTTGLAYYPIPEVAIKADYEMWKDGTENDFNVFNLGATYMF